MVEIKIETGWKKQLQEEFTAPYFQQLTSFVRKEYESKLIFPPARYIFRAFDLCGFDKTKVVILGQDPYHGDHQANGLCFAVNPGVRLPPSLVNIYKEIEGDLGRPTAPEGDLERWAEQGVLLLNATLTVEAHLAGSHQNRGWEQFTDAAIAALNREKEHLVFFLWGSYAQRKGALIDRNRHLVLESVHPSPLSAHRGFFGNHQFSLCNSYLQQHGAPPIEW